MSRLEIKCNTAATMRNGVEVKASQLLIESTIYLEPNKIPTAESIELMREQFNNIALLYTLPVGEVFTCEVVLIED